MIPMDEIILRMVLDNNAYHYLKSTSDVLLTMVDAGLDARLATAVFFITATARIVPLRLATTRLDVWNATKDIAFAGIVIHAVVVILRLFAEVFQIHIWPDEVRVNLHAVIWIILLAIFPLWIVAMYRWNTAHTGTAP